jgi:hypothetical protein
MPHIQELLAGRLTEINYPDVVRCYPWIIKRNQKCILSPDSDGLLCGLFLSKYLGWKIVGYYDGKVLLLKNGVSTRDTDCVFIDMEIYRPYVKSVGHHMVLWNRRTKPDNWDLYYRHCLQLNNLREYDGNQDFRLKYPLATIHFLIGVLGTQISLLFPQTAIAPLFFVDGTFKVLYSYPENVLNWLNYLGIKQDTSPLRKIFMHEHFTVYSQIEAMDDFFRRRDTLNIRGERGDKFVISTSQSDFKNIETDRPGTVRITSEAKEKLRGFIELLSDATHWEYDESHWAFSDLKKYQFTKGSFEADQKRVNNSTFKYFIAQNPLSWAMTSGQNIEYTLETPNSLP